MSTHEDQASPRQRNVDRHTSRFVLFATLTGGGVLLFEVLWVSWGVIARYALRSPDPYVTEATALFLMPLAYIGMAYALQEDAYPKVTLLIDKLPRYLRSLILIMNGSIMVSVGLFFAIVSGSAAWRTFHTGAASNILNWPEYILWIPTFFALALFTVLAFARLVVRVLDHFNEFHRKA